MSLQSGNVLLDRYRIERALGEGGFGYVYEATDVLKHRRVAIKELKAEVSRDPVGLQRFVREARATIVVNHPNIVTTYSLETPNGGYYLVMEYLDGGSLTDLLRARPVLTPLEAVSITRSVLQALAAIHARGIVHRDIKPSNILFSRRGEIKLGDFGIARQSVPGERSLTQTGTVLGTIHYMSPEQAHGEHADPQSDLYSLGVVLYEMLTGHPYLNFGDNVFYNANLIVTHAPLALPTTVPREIANTVNRALAKERNARFRTAMEMDRALAGSLPAPTIVDNRRVTPPRPPSIQRKSLPLPPILAVAAVAGLFLLIMVLLVIGSATNSSQTLAITAAAKTSIAMLQTPSPTQNVTSIPVVTLATVTVSPTATSTPAPTGTTAPTASSTPTATRTSTKTATRTATPLATPTQTPTPPPTRTATTTPTRLPPYMGLLLFDIGYYSEQTLTPLFWLDDPKNYDGFFDFYATPCAQGGSGGRCLQGKITVGWNDLNPTDMNGAWNSGKSGKASWLYVVAEDGAKQMTGLKALEPYGKQWVLVRVALKVAELSIDPPDFVFVQNPTTRVYEQAPPQ